MASRGQRAVLFTRTFCWLIVLAAGIAASQLANRVAEAVELIYGRALFPWIAVLIGSPGRWTTISLAQILVAAAALFVLVYLIAGTRRAVRRRSFTAGFGRPDRIAATLAVIVWGFQFAWGLNYARPPLARRLDLPPAPSGTAELMQLVRALALETNRAYQWAVDGRQYSPPDPGGAADPPRSTPGGHGARSAGLGSSLRINTAEVADRLDGGYKSLLPAFRRLPLSSPKFPPPIGWLLTWMRISGFYFPFTGEASVNGRVPDAEIPFVMAHEMAHQRGIAPEDEANFFAFLACRESGLAAARYSGALEAFDLAWVALARSAPDSARSIGKGLLEPGPLADRKAIRAFWDRHGGPVADLAHQVNHAYLKANHQKAGAASYGLAVQLLLAYQAAGGIAPVSP